MDNIPQLGTAADLEMRAARVADPGLDLTTRHTIACELREMIDSVKDSESARVVPHMVPVLLEILRSGDAAFTKDSLEYQFRRVLLEILNHIPFTEALRPQSLSLFGGMLYLLRHDNEENGVTCCKTMVDIVRTFRTLTDEVVAEFNSVLQESCENMTGLVEELLSENSAPADPNLVLPSIRSFKVLSEMGMVIVGFSQVHRNFVTPSLATTLPLNFKVLTLESFVQKKAREEYESMGGIWSGIAPAIVNTQAFTDFTTAQVKMVSYLAYVLRAMPDQYDLWGETLTKAALRLLQDCPSNAVSPRRDLIVVLRHLMSLPYRIALLPQIDKFFDEGVLLGNGVGGRESLRATAYAAVADLVHHLRLDLSPPQLAHITQVYSRLIHNPHLTNALHTLFSKMMFNLIDVIVSKDTSQGAARILGAMLETAIDRLEALAMIYQEVFAKTDKGQKAENDIADISMIEKSRPILGAVYATEKPEDVASESRLLFRTLLHGLRVCLMGLKKCEAPNPDGTLIFRMFEASVRCMQFFENDIRDSRDANEALEWFAGALAEINPHTFQEVWSLKISFFFEHAQKRPALLHICQVLFAREATSPTLVAIVLRFLVDRLPLLGNYEDQVVVVVIRWYKMAFSAVAMLPSKNEQILASHLGKLIMDCFPLAAKTKKPTHYFHLLRGLFRAIGVGGGKFELLYKEVLPLLPEMLECLNRQLYACDKQGRDMIVELCLTVPLRLTHLLPHLTYLMRPLALALKGGPELVQQGLRTLELCIDNLTADFLDPTLEIVLRELMEALQGHLKPQPANHQHSHTTIRILGKLGGRNRRLLVKDPVFQYRLFPEVATVPIAFSARFEDIELGPGSILASKTLQDPKSTYHVLAFNFIHSALAVVMHQGLNTRDEQAVFVRSLESAFDAVHLPGIQAEADQLVRELSHHIFVHEMRRNSNKESLSRRGPSKLLASYLDSLPHALARESAEEASKAQELISAIVHGLVGMGVDAEISTQDIGPILNQIASRFNSMCLDDFWVRKGAGCAGIRIISQTPDLGIQWIHDREVDLVRTLLHVLKDLPSDLPRNVEEVIDLMAQVLRVSNSNLAAVIEDPNARQRLVHLMSVFFSELSSPNPVVRRAVQSCIAIVSELSHMSPHDLLMPHRDRVLQALYTKPLRALPFSIQIGMVDAIRYCVSLEPPLPELGEELLRLLHETLALADAEDVQLLGRGNLRQGSLEVVKLRVACIRLLTAAMPMTDFYSKQPPATRQRVTGVFFKSLYSSNQEVKDVAHDGLRMVLNYQNRLPRELLQTGLRPILMNLADPKRLSSSGLEGLSRLLELLNSYFKVEVGSKLLEHFKYVADANTLQDSGHQLIADNEGVMKLARLANVFHLLPSNANIFLDTLVNAIVQVEAQMQFSSRSPFSEPLAKFLNRYPAEGIDIFMRHLLSPRHVRTLRSILQAKLAPNLQRELISRTSLIVTNCFRRNDATLVVPGLLLCSDLAELSPGWLTDSPNVIEALLHLWRADRQYDEQSTVISSEVRARHSLILSIFMNALKQTPRIDLLFDIVSVFSRGLAIDLVGLTRFLYRHVAIDGSLFFRRCVLTRFLTWFDDPSYSWPEKTSFLRLIVTPTFLVQASRPKRDGLLDSDYVNRFLRGLWQPMMGGGSPNGADDMFRIELLHLTTVLVRYYPEHMQHVKKDIIMGAWHHITSEDALVKQTAYLLAARFFEAFETPQKFILRAWTGLLRPPHTEGRQLTRQALDILAPALPRSAANETGYPQWARTTRRLLAEEGVGLSQINMIYQLIVRQPELFYPVRALFIPHMVNSLQKLGLQSSQTGETRLLSVDILQVIFDWEQKTVSISTDETAMEVDSSESNKKPWVTPLAFRETMVSYLVRLASITAADPQSRSSVASRALALIRQMLGTGGWADVGVKLNYYARSLEQNELTSEAAVAQALGSARVLQVVCAEKSDQWYIENAPLLQKLVRRGLVVEDPGLHDALHPIFDRLIKLFPLPKEEDDFQGPMAEFHSWTYSAINDGWRNGSAHRGTLLMLKSIVEVTPERIEAFHAALTKLLSKLAKENIQMLTQATSDGNIRSLISILDICRAGIGFLGEHRKWLLSTLVALVEKSRSTSLCTYLLEIGRDWALHKRDPYPTMKEKASLLQKMSFFETRGEALFASYLELIYDIYVEPTLRRSDLTTRLEQAFLLGCRARDTAVREKFVDLLDSSVPRSLFNRLTFILGSQNWEALADHHWINLALHLLLGSVDSEGSLLRENVRAGEGSTWRMDSIETRAKNLVQPLQRLLFMDAQMAHDAWSSIFPAAWACLSRREQADITSHMIALLSKDYHIKQAELRPNVIQTLLGGINRCSPPMILSPHLVKYLAKNFGAWHISLEILNGYLNHPWQGEPVVRDTLHDSLAEIYAELCEDDLFYGLWRRRSLHQETNVAVAFEQNGMWEQASLTYEGAQGKARAGQIPFIEQEYCLWEDHWILAQQKLQQWETLYELGRNDNNQDLMLESAWRFKNWSDDQQAIEEQMSTLTDGATPRRRIFEAFLALLKAPHLLDKNVEFQKVLEDAMQISLRKWVGLPSHLSAAHIPLLQYFQQFVELQEAVQIFGSLASTNAQNLEKKSSDLKMVLQAWRERLPNRWDDISIWSDLVGWRRNVFNAINKAYLPLISPAPQTGGGSGNQSTCGYRGFHETAWIINRFAHVARKHDLLDVCFTSLNMIYTLPNIEISEAFLKLREQARCYYQKPNDLQQGLETINNTNLMYFSPSQKAEFYTLKGMFHARAHRVEDANQAFGQAVQMDMGQAKAWAEWGKYNDRMFKESPNDLTHAANAVSCYLQAAGLFKNGKSRPLLTRVLWLLSVDDAAFTISRQFDQYKGDGAYWYWITLIPQLCLSISQREVKQARYILLNLAKHYPQALFYQLRTTRDDMALAKKQQAAAAQAKANANAGPQTTAPNGVNDGSPVQPGQPNTQTGVQGGQGDAASFPGRQSWEYVDEVVQILKTAFPLLILSLETMVEQLNSRFKCSNEEETYRLVCMLLQDGVQTYIYRMNHPSDDGSIIQQTQTNIARFAPSLPAPVRKEYEEEFVKSKLTHMEYIRRLQQWRDRYEKYLDARPSMQSLDLLSHYLVEFQYGKFDDIEVPGQYTEERDNNHNFVRISKFGPKFENCRSHGYCWRRLTILGHDNSKTSFAVQYPAGRHCRREERVMQVFRTFNVTLARKKETRKRNLTFHTPAAIPCSPSLRLLQNDSSYVTFADIYDQHCESTGITREEPMLTIGEKVRETLREFQAAHDRQPDKTEYFNLKTELLNNVISRLIPEDAFTKYMRRIMNGPEDLWRMRKQFASQLASVSFMTFVFSLTSRTPTRFHLSRETGKLAMSEVLPGLSVQQPVFASNEAVPFRLTPNLQHFLGTTYIEGILTSGMMAIGRSLTEPEFELEQQLCLFARDEVLTWYHSRGRPWNIDLSFRQHVAQNIENIVKRAETMACKHERDQIAQNPQAPSQVPVVQTVTNLISMATNPLHLVKMTELYHPWF